MVFKKENAFKGASFLKIVRNGRPLEIENETNTTKGEASPLEKLAKFANYFDIKLDVKIGNVYLAKFPYGIGNELMGDHFVVAVTNSNVDNPNVQVIPLTSLKEKKKNPANSEYLGLIRGIDNGKESIALLNHIQTVDKRRFMCDESIDMSLDQLEQKNLNPGEEVYAKYISYYRLTNLQLAKMMSAYNLFFKRNSQKPWKKKLVVF